MASSSSSSSVDPLVILLGEWCKAALSEMFDVPWTRLKIVLQTRSETLHNASIADPAKHSLGSHALTAAPALVRREGLTALFRGFTFPVALNFPLRLAVSAVTAQLAGLAPAEWAAQLPAPLRGLLSGGLATMLIIPFDAANTRYQADLALEDRGYRYRSMRDALAQTWRQEGLAGLYRGLGPAVVGIVVYRFAWYGTCNSVLAASPSAPSLIVYASGMVVAGLLSYPFDTLRVRCIVATTDESTLAVARRAVRDDGICGLYAGVDVVLWRLTVQMALSAILARALGE